MTMLLLMMLFVVVILIVIVSFVVLWWLWLFAISPHCFVHIRFMKKIPWFSTSTTRKRNDMGHLERKCALHYTRTCMCVCERGIGPTPQPHLWHPYWSQSLYAHRVMWQKASQGRRGEMKVAIWSSMASYIKPRARLVWSQCMAEEEIRPLQVDRIHTYT